MKLIIRFLMCLCAVSAVALEDPPNCAVVHGGLGNTSIGGINFNLPQAHIGDTVPVFPSLGMVVGACKSLNTTGTVYIATGALTNFLINVTLDPDGVHACPTAGMCAPGPYNILITAPLVGAGVTSPNGNVSGTSKAVRAVEIGVGTVQIGTGDALIDFHSASIAIVTPCIQVFESCGVSCTGSNLVNFTGYVTNCGDITLTNVTVVDDRTNTLYKLDGSSLSQPLTLTNGQATAFMGSFVPIAAENTDSLATNTITVRGMDTTTIGGPSASVTNTVTAVCAIAPCVPSCQCPGLIYHLPFRRERYATR